MYQYFPQSPSLIPSQSPASRPPRSIPPPSLSPSPQILVVAWRSQQLKQYDWGEGKCVRSWRPLQGAVVAMAIDSTSTLLATGCSHFIDVNVHMEVPSAIVQVPVLESRYGTVFSSTAPTIYVVLEVWSVSSPFTLTPPTLSCSPPAPPTHPSRYMYMYMHTCMIMISYVSLSLPLPGFNPSFLDHTLGVGSSD